MSNFVADAHLDSQRQLGVDAVSGLCSLLRCHCDGIEIGKLGGGRKVVLVVWLLRSKRARNQLRCVWVEAKVRVRARQVGRAFALVSWQARGEQANDEYARAILLQYLQ